MPQDSEHLDAEEESEEELWAAFAASYANEARSGIFDPEEDEEAGEEAGEVEEGPDPDAERVSKLISRLGIASRRAAEDIIKGSRVSINGHFVTDPGIKANPLRDTILVDGRQIKTSTRPTQVLLIHKPRNVMTTRDDPGRRSTVFDLIPRKYENFHTVGRLDFDTSGVLLVTDDGTLTHLLTHPSHGAEKTYEARVRGQVTEVELQRLSQGLQLEDGPTAPCRARLVAQREKNALVEIRLREGRNRQVRRMLDSIGHPVSGLRRVSFAGVELEGLPPGGFRVLLPGEVSQLRKRVSGKVKKQKLLKPRPSHSAPKTASIAPLPPRPAAGKVVKVRAGKPGAPERFQRPTIDEITSYPSEQREDGAEGRESRFFDDETTPRVGRGRTGGAPAPESGEKFVPRGKPGQDRRDRPSGGPSRGGQPAPRDASEPRQRPARPDRRPTGSPSAGRPENRKFGAPERPARDPKAGLGSYAKNPRPNDSRSKPSPSGDFKPFDSRPRSAGGRPEEGRFGKGSRDNRNAPSGRNAPSDRPEGRERPQFNSGEAKSGPPPMRKPSHIKPLRTNPEHQAPRFAKPDEGFAKPGKKSGNPKSAKPATGKPQGGKPAGKPAKSPAPRPNRKPGGESGDQSATARRIEKRWKD